MEKDAEIKEQATLKAEYDRGFKDALNTVRGILRLRKMGISDCEIVRKFDLDPTFIHELMGWIKE